MEGKDTDVPTIRRALAFLLPLLYAFFTYSYAGDLILIGGALQPLNTEVYESIVERLQGGPICILGLASSEPEESAQSYIRDFTRYGANAVFVDISVDNASESTLESAIAERLAACGGYFFVGGEARRITEALLVEGEDTPALATLRRRFEEGAVVAGTSAGAAALSEIMISGGSSVDTFLGGANAVSLEGGLGFIGGMVFDPHFLERGRLGRLLGALVETSEPLGVGLSEDTALIIPETGPWQVAGTGFIVFIEMPSEANLEQLAGVSVSLLASGDSFDPLADTFSVRLERVNIEELGYLYEAGDFVASDVFGPDMLAELLIHLVDSPEGSVSGLVFFGRSTASFSTDGVRIIFRKTVDTSGYFGNISSAANHSVIRAELSSEPITVSIAPRRLSAQERGTARQDR